MHSNLLSEQDSLYLAFVRYGNLNARWPTGGWVLLDSILCIQANSRVQAINKALLSSSLFQPTSEKRVNPDYIEQKKLDLLGVYEIIKVLSDPLEGNLLGGRIYAYPSWSDVESTLIHEGSLIDEPQELNQTECPDQYSLPSTYLVETTYGCCDAPAGEDGYVVIQNWNLIRAHVDSQAFERSLKLVPRDVEAPFDEESKGTMTHSRYPLLGISGLISIWDEWLDGRELGFQCLSMMPR